MFSCVNLFMMAAASSSSSCSGSSDDVAAEGESNSTPGSASSSLLGSPPSSPSNQHTKSPHKQQSGPRYKLVHEGDIQVCRLNHTRTIVSKIMNSKYLRRWESHRLLLGPTEITSQTVSMIEASGRFSVCTVIHWLMWHPLLTERGSCTVLNEEERKVGKS